MKPVPKNGGRMAVKSDPPCPRCKKRDRLTLLNEGGKIIGVCTRRGCQIEMTLKAVQP
jgi:hypothetical protein